MAMLGPMYNHLGRSPKKKRNKPKTLIAAEQEHAKFLSRMGIDPTPRRRRLKGAIPLNNAADYRPARNLPPLSDRIPAYIRMHDNESLDLSAELGE